MGGVIGIDLGTTNTVVATMRDGRVHVLADDEGHRLLPSVVSFHPNGEVLVGRAAKQRRAVDGKNTIASFKRFYGLAWGSEEIERARMRFPFEMREGPESSVIIAARGQEYSLSEMGAFVLKRCKQIAEAAMGEMVDRAVITVPAHFNELQRTATKVAGRVAGLEVLRILNEPTAAALAYGINARREHERTCVYDFGGGTFDCTILDLSGDVFEVLATSGDTFLGGDDIDGAIADRMAEAFLHQHRWDPRTDRQAFERLRLAAERVKVDLTRKTDTTIQIRELTYGVGGRNLDLSFNFSRTELDHLLAPLVERTFAVTQDAMGIAGQTVTQIDRVVLVGGSTRSPYVKQRVHEFFGVPPLDRVNPDEVVAIGAAIQAASLADQTRVRSLPKPPVPTRARALRGDQASITLDAPKGVAQAAASVLGSPITATDASGVTGYGRNDPTAPAMTSPALSSPATTQPNRTAPMHRFGEEPSLGLRQFGEEPSLGLRKFGEEPSLGLNRFGEEPSLGLPPSQRGPQHEDPSVTQARTSGSEPPRGLATTMVDKSVVTKSVPPAITQQHHAAQDPSIASIPVNVSLSGVSSINAPGAASTQRSGFTTAPDHQDTAREYETADLADDDDEAETDWGNRPLPTEPRRDRPSNRPMSLRRSPPSTSPASSERASLPPPLPQRSTHPRGLPSSIPPGPLSDLPAAIPENHPGLPAVARTMNSAMPQGGGFGMPADPFGSMPPQMYQPSVPPPQEGFAPPHPFAFGSQPPPAASPSSMPPAPFQTSPPAPFPPAQSAFPPAPPPAQHPSYPPQQRAFPTRPPHLGGAKAPTFPPLDLDRLPRPGETGNYEAPEEQLPGLPPALNPGNAVPFGTFPQQQQQFPAPGQPILHQGADLRQPGQAQQTTGQPVLVDVTPRALVVETVGGYCDVVLPRNAKIPCERTRRFATSSDGQTSVRVRVGQGERTQFVRNTLLGEIELVGLRPANRGEVTIAVTFELDPGGSLRVRALDVGSGMQAQAILQLVAVADDEPSIASMINRLAAIPVSSKNPAS
jgi:molecular chaperone DnaK